MARLNFDRLNERVQSWTEQNTQKLKSTALSLGISHRSNSPSPSPSVNKIAGRTAMKETVVSRVSFRFPRSLIWTHKGAGKGRGGRKGSQWINKFGNTQRTDPNSLGKAGSGGRKPKPWFTNVMDAPDGINRLADIVAEETGNAIVNQLFI